MLKLTVLAGELYDEVKEEFINLDNSVTLELEHSLVAISKWESFYKKPFLVDEQKTYEELIYYTKCMTLNYVDPVVYNFLNRKNLNEISDYISSGMTATTFSEKQNKVGYSREKVTSELIYYWMIALNIPMECENWHLDRLLTLVRVCQIKNTPPKKMSKSELAKRNSALNAARRKKYNTRG